MHYNEKWICLVNKVHDQTKYKIVNTSNLI